MLPSSSIEHRLLFPRAHAGTYDPDLRTEIDGRPHRSSFAKTTTPFAQHGLLRTVRDMTTWLCDAYASWQKGGVESANGRLRRWRELKVLVGEHVSLLHLARLRMELKINYF